MGVETEPVVGHLESQELEQRRVVNPVTGQVHGLDASNNDLAAALDEAREMEKALYAFRKKIGEEALRRLDASAAWTQRWGDYEVKGQSPTAGQTEWDGNDLALALADLLMQGKLDKEAVEAAVEQEVRYKPKQRGINQLLKIPGVAEYIEHAKKELERERRPPSVRKVA